MPWKQQLNPVKTFLNIQFHQYKRSITVENHTLCHKSKLPGTKNHTHNRLSWLLQFPLRSPDWRAPDHTKLPPLCKNIQTKPCKQSGATCFKTALFQDLNFRTLRYEGSLTIWHRAYVVRARHNWRDTIPARSGKHLPGLETALLHQHTPAKMGTTLVCCSVPRSVLSRSGCPSVPLTDTKWVGHLSFGYGPAQMPVKSLRTYECRDSRVPTYTRTARAIRGCRCRTIRMRCYNPSMRIEIHCFFIHLGWSGGRKTVLCVSVAAF